MPINGTGPISLGGDVVGRSVNLQLRKSATAEISMNNTDVRGLANIATGAISFNNFYGKSLSYAIAPNITSVNEGGAVTFTVTTTGLPNGTVLFWSTNTVSGTVNTADFSDAVLTGSVTINSNTGSVTRTLTNDVDTEGSESFQLQLRTESVSGTVVATSATVTINDTSSDVPAEPGQVIFTSSVLSARYGVNSGATVGTSTEHSWIVPAGVFSISVVLIGGGGAGRNFNASQGRAGGGGGGGALAYRNNITCTPGQTVTIEVGNGGQSIQTNSKDLRTSGNGGTSRMFISGSNINATVAGGDGGADGFNQTGGLGGIATLGVAGAVGFSGGRGGQYLQLGGGGGAGGYAGAGGAGGGNGVNATAGTGGGGGGGGFRGNGPQGRRSGMGGGTGLLGQGSNGTAGVSTTVFAESATDGGAGSNGVDKLYGGGGAAGIALSPVTPANGASGAVRIMWPGNLRQYPSTRTADE